MAGSRRQGGGLGSRSARDQGDRQRPRRRSPHRAAQLRQHRLRIFRRRPETAQQPRQHRRGPRQFPGRRDHRQISRRRHRHRLLQPVAPEGSGAGARSAEGPVGLSRHRNGGRARHRVRLGVRAQQAERIRRGAPRRPKSVAAGDRLWRVRLRHRAVRARISEAGAAGEEMAGRDRHHQAVGPRAIPCRANRRRAARADDVSAQGVLHLHLQQHSPTPACTPASPATSRRARTG